MSRSRNQDSGRHERWITWIFVSMIAVITLLTIVTPQKSYSASENRYLQRKPEFTGKALLDGSYGEKYEAYLSDQFPARDRWISAKVLAERLRLRTDVNGVYIGKDGYLIEKFDTEDFQGEQLEKNLEKLNQFSRKAVEKLGEGHMRILLVPSASQIEKDKLPFLASPYDQGLVVERMRQKLEANGLAKDLLVPVEQELAGRGGQLYYKTDHHWTADGAFAGYAAWAKSAGLLPWPREAFEVRTVSTDFHGTVYSKLNSPWPYDEIKLYLPIERQSYRISFDGEETAWDSLYFYDALKGKDKYAVYLDGNHGLTKIINESIALERSGKNLLIIKDSYAHSFAPFAANHFNTVLMADLRYLNLSAGLENLMDEEAITDVLVLYQIPGFAKEKSIGKLGF